MSATGRRRSTPRERAEAAAAASPTEPELVAEVAPAVELLEDRAVPIAGGHGRSLGRSVSGAVVGTLLVVGLAFGAALGPGGALGPDRDPGSKGGTAAAGSGDGTASDAKGGSGSGTYGGSYEGNGEGKDDHEWWNESPGATGKPGVEPTDKPDADPEATPKSVELPDATPKPVAKPDPTAKPAAERIALGLALKESHPFLEWGSCEGLDFDYYKVMRSTDSTVSWPGGEGDELIAAIERGGARKAYDKYAPHAVKAWYRVFCVRKGEDGYRVVNSSGTKGIEVPEEPAPPPTPDPVPLGLEAALADGGKVSLDWTACEVDGFAFYKVVGSTASQDPSYLPWHDGTDVLGVIGEMHATELEVWAPDTGHTAWYRVQCIGYWGDQKVLLGQSAVVSVTVP